MADKMDRKKLIEYLPTFMQQFAEIKQIMQVEDTEMDKVENSIWKVFDNAFIDDCDEYGIKKYEELLDITPSADDTLERRRAAVLLRWNDALPYTYRTLIRKLDKYCGENQYRIENDLEHYIIHLHTYFNSKYQISDVIEMLEDIVPLNMYILVTNNLYRDIGTDLYIHTATVKTVERTISTE